MNKTGLNGSGVCKVEKAGAPFLEVCGEASRLLI